LSNFTREFRTLTGLVLSLTTVITASSRVEAQQYVYYPTTQPAPAAAPTYTFPTYFYAAPAAQPAAPVQYYQPAAAVQYAPAAAPAQYAQPAAPVQYAQPAAPAQYEYAQPAAAAPAQAAAPTATGGDAYGFTAWLNGVRASYGLGAVGYDPNLESWAQMNNGQQAARGLGHYVMGPARRQNSAMGGFPSIESMWMASPAHRAALLDPTIQFIGIAGAGAWWTFNAY
jgi:uncharacterized protein YkwD